MSSALQEVQQELALGRPDYRRIGVAVLEEVLILSERIKALEGLCIKKCLPADPDSETRHGDPGETHVRAKGRGSRVEGRASKV